VYSYGLEKFNFGNPEIMNFLFSYVKVGLFIPNFVYFFIWIIPLFMKNKFEQ